MVIGKKLTHADYLQKLQGKNIKVIPLEKYKGSKFKILHKCECGNEWRIEPRMVLRNVKCGCKHPNKTFPLIHSLF